MTKNMNEDMPNNAVPQDFELALSAAQLAVRNAREELRASVCAPDGWKQFSLETVQSLRTHAVEQPNARELAEFLCDMVPSEFIQNESHAPELDEESRAAHTAQAIEVRMRKLRSAVIEAGLVEQLDGSGRMREGSCFRAEKLESSLDDWMRAGRHRGGEFDDAPLSKIDRFIDQNSTQPNDNFLVRCLLLRPLVVAIHIWRMLEQYPEEIARKVGWLDSQSESFE